MAPEFELYIERGKTLEMAFLYADDELVYKPITAMPSRAPVRLTVTAHGVPDNWPVRVEGVTAPTELNTGDGEEPVFAASVDANTIEFNGMNALLWKTFTPSGVVVYNKPVDLTGWGARAYIRDKVGGTILFKWDSDPLTTPDAAIEVDLTAHAFILHMSPTLSQDLTFKAGVWEMEAVSPSGDVYPVVAISKVTVSLEVVS